MLQHGVRTTDELIAVGCGDLKGFLRACSGQDSKRGMNACLVTSSLKQEQGVKICCHLNLRTVKRFPTDLLDSRAWMLASLHR